MTDIQTKADATGRYEWVEFFSAKWLAEACLDGVARQDDYLGGEVVPLPDGRWLLRAWLATRAA